MKQWKILVFLTLLLLIPVQVSAKKTLKTCKYESDSTSKKYQMKATVKIYDDYSCVAWLTNFGGESMNNKEDCQGWEEENIKSWFKKNNECPKMVRAVDYWYSTDVWIGNESVQLPMPEGYLTAYSEEELKIRKEQQEKDKKEKEEAEKQKDQERDEYLGTKEEIINETEDYYKSIVGATNHLNQLVEEYKSGSCINQSENAYITEYSDCKTFIENLKTATNEYKDLLDDYIANGYINSNDKRVTDLNEAVKNAKQVSGDAENFFRQNSEYINQRYEDVANGQETTIEKPDFYQQFTVVEESEKPKGCNIFGENITETIKWVYNLIKIGAPILVVVLGILDFIKALLAGDDKGFKEAWQRFIKRLVAAVVVILLPVLITFILDISGVLKQYGIEGNGNEIYCIFK